MKPSRPAPLELLLDELHTSRKYRDVAPEVLLRVAREALAIDPRPRDAVKRAKTALHQMHSAFLQTRELDTAERDFDALGADATPAAIEAACLRILASHASTRERLATFRELHRQLREVTGPPASVLDLGCGLHPFALPWMELPREVPYFAVDLDARLLALVGRLFRRIGQAGTTATLDLLGDAPLPRADVALLLKLLPTLERQYKGATARLLDRLDARVIVLSFPTLSLGRRDKGMEANYSEFARALLAPRGWTSRTLTVGEELFFVATPTPRTMSGGVRKTSA